VQGVYERPGDPIPRPARPADYGGWIAARLPDLQLFGSLTIKDLPFEGHPDLTGFTHVGVAGAERFLKRWWRDSIRSRGFAAGTRPYAAVAMEQHRDRVTPHFHFVAGGLPGWLVRDTEVARRRRDRRGAFIWREWFNDHGMARIEAIHGVGSTSVADRALGTAVYVSKYITKSDGKFYALGSWPPVSDFDDPPLSGDEVEDRWEADPDSAWVEAGWRELCEGAAARGSVA
jgi:hypothetical protein